MSSKFRVAVLQTQGIFFHCSTSCFAVIDVGAHGRDGDLNIFKQSNFGKLLFGKHLDFPSDRALPLTNEPILPFVFIADEAFALHENVMWPYPSKSLTKEQKIPNYRLLRARRLVECSFGIHSNRWQVLHSSILLHPNSAVNVIISCCILHNFVRRRDGFVFEDSIHCNMTDLMHVWDGEHQESL